jgi:hypothetical protein
MDLSGLSFSPGIGVQAAVWHRFSEPINYVPVDGLREFFLVASVGRCKFHLTEQCSGLLLQATLGGVAADFRQQQISDRVFRFVVTSRNVGFHIYDLKSYACEQYQIFFNLWGNSGAN